MLPDFAWTVHIQSSLRNTKEDVEFTINTGIFTDTLFGTFYDWERPKFPLEVYSVLRLRVSALKNMPDAWYRLTPTTDIEKLKRQLQNDIENVILPHFAQFQTIEDVIKEMERREEQGEYECPHFLTILYQAHGDQDAAQKRMKKIYSECKLDSQKEFTRELAQRLRLDVE